MQKLQPRKKVLKGEDLGSPENQVDQPTRLSQAHLLVRSAFHFWEISIFSDLLDRMAPSTKLEEKLEGIEKFLAWKCSIGLIIR